MQCSLLHNILFYFIKKYILLILFLFKPINLNRFFYVQCLGKYAYFVLY